MKVRPLFSTKRAICSSGIRLLFCCLSLLMLLLGSGCATVPYRPGQRIDYVQGYEMPPDEPQFVYGRPCRVLDAAGWYWPGSLLSKLILWNHKVDSHRISEETIEALKAYLKENQLNNVKVRINAISVRDEWRRTFRNKSIGAGWRYPLGFLAWLQYTIFPGRFFGGDNYNPYSNTINIYSDVPAIALHEGGHAKDFAYREWKGTYAFAYMIPFFNLYPEALATRDALSYLRSKDDLAMQKQGYNVLYPAYGTYIGGNIGGWLLFPWNYVAFAAGVIPGHIVGRVRSATLPDPAEFIPVEEDL